MCGVKKSILVNDLGHHPVDFRGIYTYCFPQSSNIILGANIFEAAHFGLKPSNSKSDCRTTIGNPQLLEPPDFFALRINSTTFLNNPERVILTCLKNHVGWNSAG